LLHELDVDPQPAIADADFWSTAFAWLAKYSHHQPDWADACLAAAQRNGDPLGLMSCVCT